MPNEVKEQTAPVAKAAAKIDYAPYVGKTFRTKHEIGANAKTHYKIVEFLPKFDFGKFNGNVRPGFRLHRIPAPGVHVSPCDDFLRDHDAAEVEFVA